MHQQALAQLHAALSDNFTDHHLSQKRELLQWMASNAVDSIRLCCSKHEWNDSTHGRRDLQLVKNGQCNTSKSLPRASECKAKDQLYTKSTLGYRGIAVAISKGTTLTWSIHQNGVLRESKIHRIPSLVTETKSDTVSYPSTDIILLPLPSPSLYSCYARIRGEANEYSMRWCSTVDMFMQW